MKIVEIELISSIKENIRRSRYNASKAVNKELILLYYSIGNLLSDKISINDWGSKVLEHISNEIQNEFKGIRGFSVRNLKNMRQFYDEYAYLQFGQLSTAQIDSKYLTKDSDKPIRQLITARFNINNYDIFINAFFSVSFTSHMLLINKCKDDLERYFYIKSSVKNQWTVDLLRYNLDSNLYKEKGKLQNNFDKIIPSKIKANAPVGVATYTVANKLPTELKKYLPSVKDFKKLLEE
ncbi:MAG: DUF1016 N-terminal domain-containing protein [Candidatus Delongbacteria bacterium]|nr:DUF1016 N-terminal domain-containing protein [Candidatus Delongbacteria bacterium]